MLIYITDDEPLLLKDLHDAVRAAVPGAEIKGFGWAGLLLNELAQTNDKPDIVFLDIEMPGISGMELAKELKKVSPNTRLVFVTGFTQYAVEAFAVRADGYVMKPVTEEKIRDELAHLRPMLDRKASLCLRVQCFGNFEVFTDTMPLIFRYAKTKELLAYLVDRKGAAVSSGELMAILWEDKQATTSLRTQLRNLLSDLKHVLCENGAEGALIKANGCYAVNTDGLSCDYYRYIRNEPGADHLYSGEYMSQYSWAELTLGALESLRQKRIEGTAG